MISIPKKVRFFVLLTTALYKQHRKWIWVSFIFGVISFILYPKITALDIFKGRQRIGIVGRYTPDSLPGDLQVLVSAGLTKLEKDGSVSPDIAESWTIGQDGKEYVFTIKNNLFWQDKSPVKASDINYYFNDVAYVAIDDYKIKFLLKEPYSPFPVIVSKPVFKKGLIGIGNYKVKSMKTNGHIVEQLEVDPGLLYRFYPTDTAIKTAFKIGEIDTIRELTNVSELTNWKKTKIISEIRYNRFTAVFFNTQDSRFANKTIRQALAYAIKDRWDNQALSSINPDSWAYNKLVKPYNYDIETAQKLLNSAKTDDKSLVIDEIRLSTAPTLLNVAEDIKSDWEQLGIKVTIRVASSLDEAFDVLLVAQEIPPDPDQYNLWHSTQSTNISHYKSPKLDNLLEEGRTTPDREKRREIYYDFQKALVEDSPAIFLFYPTVYTVTRI